MSKNNKIEFFNCSKDGLFTAVENDTVKPIQLICGSSTPPKKKDNVESGKKRTNPHINVVSKPTVSPDVIHKKLKKTEPQIEHCLQDLEGLSALPFQTLKDRNRIFFSYDPRGMTLNKDLPQKYCAGCRCPAVYCSDIVMSKELEQHVRFLVNDDTSCRQGHPLTVMSLECTVKKAYSHQVNHRMLNNGIKYVEGFNPYQGHTIPTCMRRTQSNIIEKIMKEEKTKAKKMHNMYIKNREDYYTPLAKIEANNDDNKEEASKDDKDKEEDSVSDDDLPDLHDRNSDDEAKHGRVRNNNSNCEQEADVGAMFKVMKMEVMKLNMNK